MTAWPSPRAACATWRRSGRWRAAGFDGALVGEALMRAGDPRATAASYVAAGRGRSTMPRRRASHIVKLCGIVDAAGVPGRDPRRRRRHRPQRRRGDATRADPRRGRRAGDPCARRARRPRATPHRARSPSTGHVMRSTPSSRRSDPDVVQLNGDEPLAFAATLGATGLEGAARRGGRSRADAVDRPGARRLALRRRGADPARRRRRALPGRHGHPRRERRWRRPSPARCRSRSPAAFDPVERRRRASRRSRPTGVDVASGIEGEQRDRPGSGRRRTRFAVALFVKRARAARFDRPNLPSAHARPRRHRSRRTPRSVGDGARLRRPLRPRDADGRARAARDALRAVRA